MSSRHYNLEPLGRWHATVYSTWLILKFSECVMCKVSIVNLKFPKAASLGSHPIATISVNLKRPQNLKKKSLIYLGQITDYQAV